MKSAEKLYQRHAHGNIGFSIAGVHSRQAEMLHHGLFVAAPNDRMADGCSSDCLFSRSVVGRFSSLADSSDHPPSFRHYQCRSAGPVYKRIKMRSGEGRLSCADDNANESRSGNAHGPLSRNFLCTLRKTALTISHTNVIMMITAE